MVRAIAVLIAGTLLFVVGCGKDEKTPAADGAEGEASKPKAEPKKPKIDVAALTRQKEQLAAKLKALQAEQQEMERRHREETKALPPKEEISDLKRRFSTLRNDAVRSQVKMQRMEKRLAELKKLAETSTARDLQGLRKQESEIEERLRAANATWSKARAEERLGQVKDSPVKQDLDAVRAMKAKWFELTPDARRAKVDDAKKGAINTAFRNWLGGDLRRGQICARILKQPDAPKGKTPQTYDFTNLDFFILLSRVETEIDKQNVAVEKKEAAKYEAAVDAVQAELDAVREKIAKAMQAGGDEFEEYLDLKERYKGAQSLDRLKQLTYRQAREVVDEAQEVTTRHHEEVDAMDQSIAKVKKELQAVSRKLSRG